MWNMRQFKSFQTLHRLSRGFCSHREQDLSNYISSHASSILVRRPHSQQELHRKLKTWWYRSKRGSNYEQNIDIDTVISDVVTKFCCDKFFADHWVNYRELYKPRSKRFLEQELRAKGVSIETIHISMENYDERDACKRICLKSPHRQRLNTDPEKVKTYLIRQGFPLNIVLEVMNEVENFQNVETK